MNRQPSCFLQAQKYSVMSVHPGSATGDEREIFRQIIYPTQRESSLGGDIHSRDTAGNETPMRQSLLWLLHQRDAHFFCILPLKEKRRFTGNATTLKTKKAGSGAHSSGLVGRPPALKHRTQRLM